MRGQAVLVTTQNKDGPTTFASAEAPGHSHPHPSALSASFQVRALEGEEGSGLGAEDTGLC